MDEKTRVLREAAIAVLATRELYFDGPSSALVAKWTLDALQAAVEAQVKPTPLVNSRHSNEPICWACPSCSVAGAPVQYVLEENGNIRCTFCKYVMTPDFPEYNKYKGAANTIRSGGLYDVEN